MLLDLLLEDWGGGQKNIHRAGYTKHTANSNTAYRTCIHALFAFFHL